MEDQQIVALYLRRMEEAIAESRSKYGAYCRTIAFRILRSFEDAEECENDTWLRAWNAIPPQKPSVLSAFFGKITRNLALDRYDAASAEKRGGGELPLIWEELAECVPAGNGVQNVTEQMQLRETLNMFLASLPAESRILFVRRYWYADTIAALAEHFSLGESAVKMKLSRMRNALRKELADAGIEI